MEHNKSPNQLLHIGVLEYTHHTGAASVYNGFAAYIDLDEFGVDSEYLVDSSDDSVVTVAPPSV